MEQGNLGKQFEEMGKSFQGIKENIPHIKVGEEPGEPNKNYRPDPFIDKWKRKLLIGLSVLIIGGAGLLIAVRVLGRFF